MLYANDKKGAKIASTGCIQDHVVLHSVENLVLYSNEPDSLVLRSIVFAFLLLGCSYLTLLLSLISANVFFSSFLCDSLETLKNEDIVSSGTSFSISISMSAVSLQ